MGIRRKRDMGKHIPSFGIYEFKRLVGLADKKMSPFPKTKEEMWQELNILAKDLKTYCQSVLKGDMSDFSVIEKERKEAEWRYTQ